MLPHLCLSAECMRGRSIVPQRGKRGLEREKPKEQVQPSF